MEQNFVLAVLNRTQLVVNYYDISIRNNDKDRDSSNMSFFMYRTFKYEI